MQQYIDLVEKILTDGREKKDRTGVGTYSLHGETMRFDMRDGFPLVWIKKTNYDAMTREQIWFLGNHQRLGEGYENLEMTNIKYLVDNGVNIWNEWPHKYYVNNSGDTECTLKEFKNRIKNDWEFANEWGNLGPVYGHQWRKWIGKDGVHVDQLANAIQDLKEKPWDRGIIVNAWNSSELKKMLLRPCHMLYQFITAPMTTEERMRVYRNNPEKYGKGLERGATSSQLDQLGVSKYYLDIEVYQRSVDTMLGLPFDIASYSELLTMVAQVTNMVPRELIYIFGDSHVYQNHIDGANEMIDRWKNLSPSEHYGLPTVDVNPEIDDINDFQFEDLVLNDDYQYHPWIKLPVAV